jgi:hypothetical protein
MIVNFKYTKWFLTRFLFAASIIANIYAVICLQATETSLEGCEKYIQQLDIAAEYYAANFGEAE